MDDKAITEVSTPEIETALKALQAKYREGGGIDQPAQDELPFDPPIDQPAETVSAPPETPPAPAIEQPPAPPQPESLNPAQQAADAALAEQRDDATLALKQQIESLRQSEQMRQQPPQRPMTREARLAQWHQHGGLSHDEIQFFQKHPEMIDFPQITGVAVSEAKQAGLARGTNAHLDFVEKAFNAQIEHLMREANPDMQPTTPTPQFFKPPPVPGRSLPNPSSLVSAPVSRSIPNGSGSRPRGKVTLTPTEVEAARLSGVTVEEYARQKAKYQGMLEDGSYRDNRDQRS